MTLEKDEVTSDWDCVRPGSYCVLPGHEEEECNIDQDNDFCCDCDRKHRFCDPEEDGSMLLSEVKVLPDGAVQWVDEGKL